jgi:hypothetical protein
MVNTNKDLIENTSEDYTEDSTSEEEVIDVTKMDPIERFEYNRALCEKFRRALTYIIYPKDTRNHFPVRAIIPNIFEPTLLRCLHYLTKKQENVLQEILNKMKTLVDEQIITIESALKLVNSYMLLCDLFMNVPLVGIFPKMPTENNPELKIVDSIDFYDVIDATKTRMERSREIKDYLIENLDFVKITKLSMKETFGSILYDQNLIIHYRDYDNSYRFFEQIWLLLCGHEEIISVKFHLIYEEWLRNLGNSKLKRILDVSSYFNPKNFKNMPDSIIDACVSKARNWIIEENGLFNDENFVGLHFATKFEMEEFRKFF